jgi:Fic family protein
MRLPEKPPEWAKIVHDKGRVAAYLKVQSDPKFLDVVRTCEAEYWPWQELKFRARGLGFDPELVWVSAKIARQSRYKPLPLRGSGSASLKYSLPDALQHELMLVDQQLAGGLVSGDDVPPAASQREKFIINTFQEEAIASSMLEGAATTRQEAKQLLKAGRKPRSQGEQMVVNNYQAIQFIRENRSIDLSPEFLIEIQRILTEKTLDDSEQVGRFRTDKDSISVVDVRDNEVLHIPPPASELKSRLKALCEFANRPPHNDKAFTHPVVAASVLHFQLGFDHPFCDGNGRTARALFYWMMLRSGYWLFEYLPISRLIFLAPARYTKAFLYSETDDFDITYFLMYKARIIARARKDLREYIAKKQEQIAQARKLFSTDSRLNHRQREVVLQATRAPERYFTIAEHQRQYGVTYATARADFLKLVQWKYLVKTQAGKKFEFTAGEKVSGL